MLLRWLLCVPMKLPPFIQVLVVEMLGSSVYEILKFAPGLPTSDQWEITRDYIAFSPIGFRQEFSVPLSDATWQVLGLPLDFDPSPITCDRLPSPMPPKPFTRFAPSKSLPLRCCTCAAIIKDRKGRDITGLAAAKVQCSKCRQ